MIQRLEKGAKMMEKTKKVTFHYYATCGCSLEIEWELRFGAILAYKTTHKDCLTSWCCFSILEALEDSFHEVSEMFKITTIPKKPTFYSPKTDLFIWEGEFQTKAAKDLKPKKV